MRQFILGFITALGIIGKPTVQVLPAVAISPTPSHVVYVAPITDHKLFTAVNKYRKSKGLDPYIQNKQTCDRAFKRSQEIAKDFSHHGFWEYSKVHPGGYIENLAVSYNKDFDVLSGWIHSPTHQKNLVSSVPFVCIMTYTDPKTNYVYTAMWGTREQ